MNVVYVDMYNNLYCSDASSELEEDIRFQYSEKIENQFNEFTASTVSLGDLW